MAEHLEGLQIVMHDRKRVLSPVKVVQRDVELAIELLEGIEEEEEGVRRFLLEPLSRRVGVEMLRLKVKGARCGLELRLVDRRRKLAPAQIEVAIPQLRLPLAGSLAHEVTTQRLRVFPENPWHPARAGRECLVRKYLLPLREVDNLFRFQRLQVHDGQRGVDEGPARRSPLL